MAIDPAVVSGAAGLVAGLGAVGWQIYRSAAEKKKTREAGLLDNPDRCARHEIRLTELEKRYSEQREENREDHNKIFGKLEALAIDVARANSSGRK